MQQPFLDLNAAVNKLIKPWFWGREKTVTAAKESLAALQDYCTALENEKPNFEEVKKAMKQEIDKTQNDLQAVNAENADLSGKIAEQEVKLRNFELVSDALKAEPVENSFITEFETLIYKDFTEFCDIEPYLNNARYIQKLQFVLKEMRTITHSPALYSKSLGAVGGGFSSGKSSFLNSFLTNSQVRLAEGIKPVTAIPSYVMYDDHALINGVSYKGGLFEIPEKMYNSISHEFLKFFSFNLKEIIKHIMVLVPINKDYFSDLCLIDTPGYNAPNSGTAAHDFKTAREYIKNAQFLIWIVGLDTNGTISKSDLDFLQSLGFGKSTDRLLYIVANKAELKKEDDIEDILDEFEECLDDADLNYSGICAYSSKTKKTYASRRMDVYEFLAARNRPSKQYEFLNENLFTVFSAYIEGIQTSHNENESKRKEAKKLLFKALESGAIGVDESSSELEAGINAIVKYFQAGESVDKRLDRVIALREKFTACLDNFCDQMCIEKIEYVFCTQCGKRLKKEAQFCTECGKAQNKKN